MLNMKRIASTILAVIFFSSAAFAHEYCRTETRTAYDEDGNIVAQASCRRCDPDEIVARIAAGVCADAGLRAMLPNPNEEDAPPNP